MHHPSLRRRAAPHPRLTAGHGRRSLAGIGAALCGCALLATSAAAYGAEAGSAPRREASAESSTRPYRLELRADAGFLAVLAHDYQKGSSGSTFDFAEEGGQDVLFAVRRFALSLEIGRHHRVSLLYQPLALETRETLTRAITVDGTTFDAGSAMSLFYGFPFYRAGYAHGLELDENSVLRLGGALQIRNATVEFARADGTSLVSQRDVGLVPLLHAGIRTELGPRTWLELEVDGIYAPIRYLNGNDNGVEGALIDANARFGLVAHEHVDTFINARYLAGGAEGSDGDDADSYSSNWLQFFVLSVGVALH